MVFNDELLFLHVPKTAGMAVSEALTRSLRAPVYYAVQAGHEGDLAGRDGVRVVTGRRHQNLATVDAWFEEQGLPHRVERFRRVLVMVRNPYAMEVSRYHYLRKGHAWDSGRAQVLALAGDFPAFVAESRWWFDFRDYYTVDGFVPDNLLVVRQEALGPSIVLGCAGCFASPFQAEAVNTTQRHDYRDYLTADLEPLVYRKYQWVFDKGYYAREVFSA
ncbi:hypothetical protein [Pseudohaliea sp.]|uniref:hypothetical protein n=1 Tax=Pseudohaliea sp. TaxID=2740289 RepID=UPI0032EBC124